MKHHRMDWLMFAIALGLALGIAFIIADFALGTHVPWIDALGIATIVAVAALLARGLYLKRKLGVRWWRRP